MGVAHKLTQEVIDFIISYKTEYPDITCRAMAAIAKERFDIVVSKSSVSSIWRTENLNSPVGRRRPKQKETKTFRIPENRKKLIFQNMPSFESSDQGKGLAQAEPDLAPPSRNVDGVGAVFLCAAEWHLTSRPILSTVLSHAIEESKDQDKAAKLLLLMPVFRLASEEELLNYSGRGLFSLAESSAEWLERNAKTIIRWDRDRETRLRFLVEITKCLTLIYAYKIYLTDGSHYFIDASSTAVWDGGEFSCFRQPAARSAEKFAETLAMGTKPLFLYSFCQKTKENEGFLKSFFDSFENKNGKEIEKVVFLGEKGKNIAEFPVFSKKRSFFAGIWPWHETFSKLMMIKSQNQKRKIKRQGTPAEIHYYEADRMKVRSLFGGANLRALVLFEMFSEVPFCIIITNTEEEDIPAERAIEMFLSRWSTQEQNRMGILLSAESDQPNIANTREGLTEDIAGIVEDFGKSLSETAAMALSLYSQDMFFPQGYRRADFYTLQNRFYSLSGQWLEKEKELIVNIEVPEGYPYLEDLRTATKRLNSMEIQTFTKKRVAVVLDGDRRYF